jgi:predicted DNA-binding transcriptional regulator AlpA
LLLNDDRLANRFARCWLREIGADPEGISWPTSKPLGILRFDGTFDCHQDQSIASASIKTEAGRARPTANDLTVRKIDNVLPTSLAPRGLSRVQAAAYIGVSVSLFDALVKDQRMPRPVRINARLVWDRLQLDEAFAALPHDGVPEEWSEPIL